jgi:DNA-binding transcriptional LysR family regulator
MDHMQAIKAFARVVETGGFTRAADSLQMPNATVSKQIQQLERHLGVKLFERTTRRVRVTSDGAAYYERVRHLLAELDEIETTLGRAQTRPRGRLRVDTGGSTASNILIPALAEFRARYPEIQLQLGVTDRTVDLIGENIDCAIRSTAQDPALIARRIGLLPWTLCASPAYFARHGVPRHPRQLIEEDFPVAGYFSNSSGVVQPIEFRDRGEPFLIEPKYGILVNESNAHVACALAGLGLVHTLDFMVRPSIERGELMAVLSEFSPKPLEMFVVYPPSRQLSTKVRVFIEWTTQIFERLSADGA